MEAAWNRGDFRGYMAGFKNPDVIFVSGGKFQAGWQGTLDHYIRDYGGSAERRGHLHFYNMKVDLLAPDAAMLVGQYRLERGPRVTEGVNTRLFRKIARPLAHHHEPRLGLRRDPYFDRARSALRSASRISPRCGCRGRGSRRSPGSAGSAQSASASAPAAAQAGCAG